MKKLTTIIIFIPFIVSATLIKDIAYVHAVSTNEIFAILFDSTYVAQSYISKSTKPYIELYANLDENDYKSGRIICEKDKDGYCDYRIKDTIPIFGLNKDTIGLIWKSEAGKDYYAGITDLRTKGNGFQVSIDGFIDSVNIYEFKPWNSVIKNIDSQCDLFKVTYKQIQTEMFKIKNRCSSIKGNGIEYSHTYNEELPNPRIALLYVFNNNILVGIWGDIKLSIHQNKKFKGGILYYHDSLKPIFSDILKGIKKQLEFKP